MNSTPRADSDHRNANVLMAIGALLIYGAVLSSLSKTFGLSDRHVFWLLFLTGMTLCARGPLGKGQHLGWWNPRHLLGYLLGSLALLLGAAMLFDFALPGIGTPRTAVLALCVLMAIKAGVARLYPRRVDGVQQTKTG